VKFDDLDAKMRVFETVADTCVLPELYMVARLDGRSFTRLTKETHPFDTPFDSRFRDMMVATTESLMTCGFRVIYGYTESDEISLLFARNENTFGRKLRKYNSVLAGEASAKFSLLCGSVGAFDCRVSQLPTPDLVVDYFRWRSADATRNALNSWCYWMLRRKTGKSKRQATSQLLGLSISEKNELLFQYEINFNDLPAWQKRGVGVYWEHYDKPSVNPVTGECVVAGRRRIRREYELPMKDEYSEFIRAILG